MKPRNKYPPTADPLQLLRLRPHNAPPGMGFFYAAGGREARATIRDKNLLATDPVDVIATSGRVLFTLYPPAPRTAAAIFDRHHAAGRTCTCPHCQLHRRRVKRGLI